VPRRGRITAGRCIIVRYVSSLLGVFSAWLLITWCAPCGARSGGESHTANEGSSALRPPAPTREGHSLRNEGERARALLNRGHAAFAAGEFEVALIAFTAAHEIDSDPRSSMAVARCLHQLGRFVNAYDEYDLVVREATGAAGEGAQWRTLIEQAREQQASLRPNVGFVVVDVIGAPRGARLAVNSQIIERWRWGEPITVTPGDVEIELRRIDLSTTDRQVTVAAGATRQVTLSAALAREPLNPLALGWDTPGGTRLAILGLGPDRPLTTYAYGAVAVGAMGFGAFDALGHVDDEELARLEAACTDGVCSPHDSKELAHKRAANLWARIGLALGVVGVGSAISLWVLEDEDGPTMLMVSPSGVFVRGKM